MSDPRRRLPRLLTTSGLILSIALVAAACTGAASPSASSAPAGSSEPAASSEPATSTEPGSTASSGGAVCTDLAALEASITALGDVDLTAGGTAALAAAVEDVKTSAEALKASASTELAGAVDTFTTQLDALQTAVTNLGSGDASGLVAVGTAISGLVSSAQELETQFKAACP